MARRTKGLRVIVIEEKFTITAVRLDVVNDRCGSDMA
jgi:hypothetical protein